MLTIHVPAGELFDERKQEFLYTQECDIVLEHSLRAIARWESKWRKIFLQDADKSYEETLDYVRCMTVNEVDPKVYLQLKGSDFAKINKYIETSQSATVIRHPNKSSSNSELVSSETIYYWMVSYRIPFEADQWHLSRLLSLIDICNVKNQPAKKQSIDETIAQNRALNKQRCERLKTRG